MKLPPSPFPRLLPLGSCSRFLSLLLSLLVLINGGVLFLHTSSPYEESSGIY